MRTVFPPTITLISTTWLTSESFSDSMVASAIDSIEAAPTSALASELTHRSRRRSTIWAVVSVATTNRPATASESV